MAHHIVVIDDDLALQEFYRLFLEGEGYQVTILSPFTFSLSSIALLHADLFILDLLIGSQQSGWSILQALRSTLQTAAIPVLLATALPAATFEAEREKFAPQQNIPSILKPFDVDALLATLKSLLSDPFAARGDSTYNDPIN
ncbi:MAG TPA: response regulator [Ktedonobacteraceae bacterium]